MRVRVPSDENPPPRAAADPRHRSLGLAGVSRLSGALVALIGGAHFVAWVTGALAERGASVITMKTNTALCLLLLGAGLVLLVPVAAHRAARWAARSCAGLAVLIGALTFSENLVGWDLGIDQLLAIEAPGAMGMVSPNRMGSPASFSVIVIGAALLLLGRERPKGHAGPQALALGACLVGLLPTIGYLYGVQWLYGLARISAIAWPTALSIVALGAGVLCARPSEGLLAQVIARDAGGTVVRRLLPPVVLLPIVLGWFEVTGQRWGWFDPAMGTASLMLIFVVSLSALTWLTGRRGSRAAAELGAQKDLLAVTLNSIGDAVVACDAHARVTFLNPVGVALTGWRPEEAVGLPIQRVFRIVDERTGQPAEDIVGRVLREGQVVALDNHTALVTRDGSLVPIEDSAAPIRDVSGDLSGAVLVFHDVADKRRAQEALRESDMRFRLALRNAPVSVAAQDRDLKYLWSYNQKTAPAGGIIGLRDDQIFTPEEAERVTAIKRRVLEQGIELREQMWFARPSGPVFLDVCWEPLRDEAGRVTGVASATMDLTPRKLAEDALRRSEEKFAKAFRGNTSAMAITRLRDGVFIDVNDCYLETAGFARQAVIGTSSPGLRIWEHPEERDAFVHRLLQDGEVRNSEYAFVKSDGTQWTGLVSAQVSQLEGEQVIISSIVDITERKRQERRVEELSRLYAVLSKVNEAIVRAGDPLSLYRDVCRIVAEDGQRPLVWIGLVEGRAVKPVAVSGPASDYVRDLRVEIDGDLGRGPTGRCVREGRPVVNDDFGNNPSTAPWKENALKYDLRASAAFPLRHQGAIVGALMLYGSQPGTFDEGQVSLLEALCADVSYALDKMWQEQALKESERSLREADRRKDEFLAMLSHELRNPLAPIRGGIYILEHAAPGGEQARRAHAVIDRQVAHLTRLVDDLLDVTRISRGKIRLQREPIDFAELVRRVVEDHRSAFTANNLALEAAISAGPIWIDADATRVAQVIGNLLHNASKFTPAGGHVTVVVEREGGHATARIRDDGTGIDPDMLARVFEPFTQAATTMDRSRGGLGLGLALVKGLVELHAGQVAAHSDGPGKGAEVVVRFPLGAAAYSSQAHPAVLPYRPRRILIIEDHADAAECLQTLLELGGHDVRVAFNGQDGLRAARAFMPDVVLCDIGLPGMDGFDVARAFRADPSLGGIVLVALSGYALQEDVQRAMEAGFHRHLAKPADPKTVERMLAELAPTTLGR